MISTFQVTLTDRKELTHDVYHFTFSTNGHQFEFLPGQYVILHIPQADGKTARRLYSMASPNTQKESFDLIVEILENGVASQHLMKMNIGDTLTVQGPAGMFTTKETDRHIVFLATGTGIAPMRSMLHHLLEKDDGKDIYLLWGHKQYHDVYLMDDLKEMASKHPNFRFVNCLSREENLSCITNQEDQKYFQLGHVNDKLEEMLSLPIQEYQFFLCGGPKVVESLKEWLASKNVPKEQVHFEKFTI